MGQKKARRARWSQKKGVANKHASKQLAEVVASITSMASSQPERIRPVHPTCCFNMQLGLSERERLIDYLWTGEFSGAMGELLAANPEMAHWHAEITKNRYHAKNASLHATKQTLKFESMIAQELRCQNEHIMPLWTVLNSIDAHRAKRDRFAHMHLLAPRCTRPHLHATEPAVCRASWHRDSAVRLLASPSWTSELIKDAIPRWPGPGYKTAHFVSALCFDNFTVQVNYNTTHSSDTQGFRLDMTNWATVHLPLEAAPNLDIRQVLHGECSQLAQSTHFSQLANCAPHCDTMTQCRPWAWWCMSHGHGGA